ncbi:isoamylase [Massilia sp. W12]|uniref:glycogen debranching protein n=1 Tax=Massilia sp. W12 TaxID=3126507 RepID=UPI0030CF603A
MMNLLTAARAALCGLALAAAMPTPAAINSMNLGAKYDAAASNIQFRLFSSRATRIEVWLYAQAQGATEKARYVLTRDANNVWSVSVPVAALKSAGISGTVFYGYRAWGPNWVYSSGWSKGSAAGFIADVDAQGNRFNPNKLLIDPYALELSHDQNPANAAFDNSVYGSGPKYRLLDSAPRAPKGIVLGNISNSTGVKPTRAAKDDIIYEVHVRGLTMNDPAIPAACRGTYKGAGQKAASLAALGVTAVEFLPLQETDNDGIEVDPNNGLRDNYWGYMTTNFFAPDRRYACNKAPGGPTAEFREMVKAFHDAGIKVYVDVVYNHTSEEGPWNAGDANTYGIYSYRGLDNPTYYTLSADKQSTIDNTGVGGNFNSKNPIAQNLIIDSLAYWSNTLGVDGFRFDLASVLGNSCESGCFHFDKNDSNNALNRITREFTVRPATGGAGLDLIAEPWAIGGNSYQVGGFPAAWGEWNGQFRDVLRQSQNKMGIAPITPGQIASRIAGSADLYQSSGRKPWHSVNFITAHDGFTLKDLYACNQKSNNQPWPYGASDGGEDHNNSWDQGGIAADQRKAARNGLLLTMLAAGRPMLNGGDEYLRSLQCNNNPYNLDNAANWLSANWSVQQSQFHTFAKRVIAFRKAHPALRPQNFYSAADNNGNGLAQLAWFRPDGQIMDAAYFNDPNNRAMSWRIDGSEFDDNDIYVAYNGWQDKVNFTLPAPRQGKAWYRVGDTAPWNEGDNSMTPAGAESYIGPGGTVYGVHGRSVLLLIAK